MRQLDLSECGTSTGEIWRLAGVTDYFTRYEHGRLTVPTCTPRRPTSVPLPVNPETGEIQGDPARSGESSGHRQRRSVQGRRVRPVDRLPPRLLHIPARAKFPGQNAVREHGFGSLEYDQLSRVHEQIATVEDLYRQAEATGRFHGTHSMKLNGRR